MFLLSGARAHRVFRWCGFGLKMFLWGMNGFRACGFGGWGFRSPGVVVAHDFT